MKPIYKKLATMQKEIKVPKTQKNDFGNFYYRTLDDIYEALKPLLAKHGLAIYLSDEITEMHGRVYVKSTATLVDIETGDNIQAYGLARECEDKKGMDQAMITGSCSTYAKKYCLAGLFLIDSTAPDVDSNEMDSRYVPSAQQNPGTPANGAFTPSNQSRPRRVPREHGTN